MQREKHLEYIARDAVSKVVQNSKLVDELPLPKSIKADIVKYMETPPHKRQLKKWFGCQVREKALYYWCPDPMDYPLSEDIECYNEDFDFYYVNRYQIKKLNEDYSKLRRDQLIIILNGCWYNVPANHPIYRMIERFLPDLVILSHLPPEIFFSYERDTLNHILTVQREYPPNLSLSDRLIRDWLENRPHRKALYYWCLPQMNFIESYSEITRHVSDRSQILFLEYNLSPQTSYPENCQLIIVNGFNYPSKNNREFLMRAITKQYDNLLDEETGEPCHFKRGADLVFISYGDPKYSFGSAFTKDCFDLVIQDELIREFPYYPFYYDHLSAYSTSPKDGLLYMQTDAGH